MNFKQRLKFYLFGFILGLGMVYVFFGEDRVNAWLPGNRIISHLQGVPITLSEQAQCQMACMGLTLDSVKTSLPNADPNLDQSDIRGKECPIYHIEFQNTDNKDFGIKIESCKENAVILSIEMDGISCNC